MSLTTKNDGSGRSEALTEARVLPTEPCSVVWSGGHAFVRERGARWVGIDDRGRPEVLTDADLYRRGWTLA